LFKRFALFDCAGCSKRGAGDGSGGRQACFFEKRSKNACSSGLSLSGEAEAEITKSFLLLFFKKEGLTARR
jgi:hypothetical protein